VWVSRPRTANGAGAEIETVEARLRAAHGVVGTGTEYVRTLVHALEPHGLHDPLIETLWARLRG
jgi:cation transport regulator ChaC